MWDGFAGAIAGAIVGGGVSLAVALLVLRVTRRDNVDLAREQASLDAARELSLALDRLHDATSGIRDMSDRDAHATIRKEVDVFDQKVIAFAPALREEKLRSAVRKAGAVQLNFGHYAFGTKQSPTKWTKVRVRADVLRADYLTVTRDALIDYREGSTVRYPLAPGWAWRPRWGDGWRWRVPLGVNSDGSGEPEPGWTLHEDHEGEFWKFADD